MRLMGVEATYRRPRTSVASPEHRVFPYLPRGLAISRADHVWCADITHVPVTQGFFHLVAVMDWATRHVLAWRLSNTMDASFCVEALDDALGWRAPEILNADQGAQFTSEAFADRVLVAGAAFSMDGRGRFLDNIFIERLWRSLKYEAVYLHELRDGLDAERIIGSCSTSTTRCARIRPSAGGRRAMPTATARGRCERRIFVPAGARPREPARPGSHAGSPHAGRLAPTAAKPRSPARVPLPATGAHVGTCPSPAGGGPAGGAPTPRQLTENAPEGSHNHSESTLTLPSDCPTK